MYLDSMMQGLRDKLPDLVVGWVKPTLAGVGPQAGSAEGSAALGDAHQAAKGSDTEAGMSSGCGGFEKQKQVQTLVGSVIICIGSLDTDHLKDGMTSCLICHSTMGNCIVVSIM